MESATVSNVDKTRPLDSVALCIVGAGVAGMNAAVVASKYLPRGTRVLLLDRQQAAGGMWNHTYPYVRLHQPYRLFTAADVPWSLDREPSYLADREEVLHHLHACLGVAAEHLEIDQHWGWNYCGHALVDDSLIVTASDPAGVSHTFKANRLIDATGFDLEVNLPLVLTSAAVRSVAPESLKTHGLLSADSDTPVWVIGSGKTAIDTANAIIRANPNRALGMVTGAGTYFFNRDKIYRNGRQRWWSGMRPNALFTEIARRYDGTNERDVTAWFVNAAGTRPLDPAPHCLFGLLSEAETESVRSGLGEVVRGHLADVVDDVGGPMMILRGGERRRIEPGSWIVNCTGHLAPRDMAYRPYVSEGGRVLSINSSSMALGFSSVSAYFLSHLFFLERLQEAPLYEVDFHGLRRLAPESTVAVLSTLIMHNLGVIFGLVPLTVFQDNRLDFDRWYPTPRRLVGQLKFMASYKRDRPKFQKALDMFSATSGVRCGPLVSQGAETPKPERRITGFRRGTLQFDVRDEGPLDGTPVVLLHGFPQRASSWDRVAPLLHEAGFRTYAPDQRGYSPGARPRSRWAYSAKALSGDVAALIDAIGEPVHLVGHDWGATAGWVTSARYPTKVRSLTAVSVGHPAAFIASMFTSDQARRSYYMALFQLPRWPERTLAGTDTWGKRFLRGSGMTTEQLTAFDTEIVVAGALRGGLNWYRALPLATHRDLTKVRVPTTLVWSEDDIALGRKQADTSAAHVNADYDMIIVPGATHWIPEERPDTVADAIIRRANSSRRAV